MANVEVIIEVAYASEQKQSVLRVEVPLNTTVKEAIVLSGICKEFPEIDLDKQTVGIFSKKVSLDAPIKAGDRIEIYRPLVIDPKQARQLRAERYGKKQQNSAGNHRPQQKSNP